MGKLADESAGLRMELNVLRNENDTTLKAMDNMLSDLITTQQELEEKKGTLRESRLSY